MSGAKSTRKRANSVNALSKRTVASAAFQKRLDAGLQNVANYMLGKGPIFITHRQLKQNQPRFLKHVNKTYGSPKSKRGGGKTRRLLKRR